MLAEAQPVGFLAAANSERTREYLLHVSMIASLRRAEELG